MPAAYECATHPSVPAARSPWSQLSRGPRGARCLAGLLAIAATPFLTLGCRSGKVASDNLDALHDADGRYHYRARLQTPRSAFLANLVNGFGLQNDNFLLRQKEREVKNPARRTLENLLELKHGPNYADASPSLRAHRVRQYAYLSCNDPSALVRERALIELGFVAAAAGLERPAPINERPPVPANGPELSEAVAGLAEVVQPLADSDGPLTETQREDLRAAAELLEGMHFDVEGAHRLLAVTAAVLDRRDADGPFAPVAAVSAGVERVMIEQALARCLEDPDPRTRAAAFEANWRAYGDLFLREAMRALVGNPPSEDSLFGLQPVWAGDEDLFLTVFRLVRQNGLPSAEGDREGRLEYLFALTSVAVQYTLFSDRIRNAAMLALSEVSDSGIKSLRLEDWQAWWAEYGEAEGAAIDREKRAAQKGAAEAAEAAEAIGP